MFAQTLPCCAPSPIPRRVCNLADYHSPRLFERGADSVGLDFLAHPFWDKYLEYEERMEQEERVFALLERIIHIPLHQYSRYFERYHTKAARLPTSRLVSAELLAQFTEEATRAAAVQQKGAADIEQDIRTRIGASQVELFHRTQAETGKRWTYEQEVKRPYYHVTELDEDQLSNWRKYLDFEEAEGDYSRIRFLYERCLVTAANYQEFWLRYARWMSAHPGKEQEVRNIYQRACCIYVPIARPEIRLYYAYFEEAQGKPDTAMEILDGVLMTTPGHTASIVELANIHRRHTGLEAAISELQRYIDNEQTAAHTRGALVSEHARLLWKFKGTPKEARKIYESHRDKCLDCRSFWVNWLQFEIEQPTSLTEEPKRYKHIKSVFDDIRRSWTFSQDLIKEVTATYFHYLQERGGKDQIAEFIELDREMNGPPSVKGNAKKASAPSTEGAPSLGAGPTATANHQPTLQSLYPNGPTLPAR